MDDEIKQIVGFIIGVSLIILVEAKSLYKEKKGVHHYG